MRGVLALGAVLVLLIGGDLIAFNAHTDTLFAWHVKSPATAAFLGCFYVAACVLAALSFRRRVWAEARVGILGVFVFVCLTLWLALSHLDQLQFHGRGLSPLVAYTWVVVYAVDPLLIVGAWLIQRNAGGSDPPCRSPAPSWYRYALAAFAAGILVAGCVLVLLPASGIEAWPWAADAMDVGAIGAWTVGLSIVVDEAAWEGAWERIEVAVTSATALGALQLLVLVWFRGSLAHDAHGALLVTAVLCLLLLGTYGTVAARRAGMTHEHAPAGRTT